MELISNYFTSRLLIIANHMRLVADNWACLSVRKKIGIAHCLCAGSQSFQKILRNFIASCVIILLKIKSNKS